MEWEKDGGRLGFRLLVLEREPTREQEDQVLREKKLGLGFFVFIPFF